MLDDQLQAVEHTLAVHDDRVIAIGAFGVKRGDDAVIPLIYPQVRQVVRAYIDYGIYGSVYVQLENGRAIATLRRRAEVVVGTGGREGITEEDDLLTLDDMLNTVVIVCFVHCQNQRMDTVATVHALRRVAIDTCHGKVLALVSIAATLTDRYACGVECLLVDAEL